MSKAGRAVAAYGAGILLKHLDALTAEIDGVRRSDDEENLHRMRVASRRLRAALTLFARPVSAKQSARWKREVRRVTRALGAARDADVQIEQIDAYLADLPAGPEQAGVLRLRLRKQQHREKLQPKVIATLNRFESSGAIKEIREKSTAALPGSPPETTPSRLYLLAYRSIGRRLGRLLAFEEYVDQPERADELHAMRIAAKRLRYTLEMFVPLYRDDRRLKPYLAAVKEAQELLGQIHDCDVWIEQLPVFIEKERSKTKRYYGHDRPFNRLLPGLQAFLQDRQQQRANAYLRFRQCWHDWRSSGLWQEMMETIRRTDSPDQPQSTGAEGESV